MTNPDITIKVDTSQIEDAEKTLKSILKLLYQIEAVAGKSWLLRIILGFKLGKRGKK